MRRKFVFNALARTNKSRDGKSGGKKCLDMQKTKWENSIERGPTETQRSAKITSEINRISGEMGKHQNGKWKNKGSLRSGYGEADFPAFQG